MIQKYSYLEPNSSLKNYAVSTLMPLPVEEDLSLQSLRDSQERKNINIYHALTALSSRIDCLAKGSKWPQMFEEGHDFPEHEMRFSLDVDA